MLTDPSHENPSRKGLGGGGRTRLGGSSPLCCNSLSPVTRYLAPTLLQCGTPHDALRHSLNLAVLGKTSNSLSLSPCVDIHLLSLMMAALFTSFLLSPLGGCSFYFFGLGEWVGGRVGGARGVLGLLDRPARPGGGRSEGRGA